MRNTLATLILFITVALATWLGYMFPIWLGPWGLLLCIPVGFIIGIGGATLADHIRHG